MESMIQTTSSLDRFRLGTAEIRQAIPSDGSLAIVKGLALPFNTPDDRWGLTVLDGRLVEFDYTIFTQQSFSNQLAEADSLARVRYTWQHAEEGGRASLPIGRVFAIWPDVRGLYFEAEISDTGVGADVIKALRRGEAREVSTMISVELSTVEPRNGAVARVVTQARLWEVSQVLWAQFADAAVTELRCSSCDALCTTSTCPDCGCENRADDDAPRPLQRMTRMLGAQFSGANIKRIKTHVQAIQDACDKIDNMILGAGRLQPPDEEGEETNESRSSRLVDLEANVRLLHLKAQLSPEED